MALEIKQTGVIETPFGPVIVASMGEPDPIDFKTFDVLRGAKILEPSNTMFTIEENGNESKYFIGESSDALYLSEKPTGKNVSGVLISENFKTQKDPFSDLMGYEITQIIVKYFTVSDMNKNLPYEVIFASNNGLVYQMTSDSDGAVLVFKDVNDKLFGPIGNALLSRGDRHMVSY